MTEELVRLDLVLVGFGNVARRFVRLLEERRERLVAEERLAYRIIGITTRHHGAVFQLPGIDALRAADLVEAGEPLGRLRGLGGAADRYPSSGPEFIRHVTHSALAADPTRHLVVIEASVLDIRRGEPATEHVRTALECGAHVASVNKGPVAFAWQALDSLARARRRAFFFEGAVMDGVPVFNLVRGALPASSVRGFRGVVNTTTNFILSAMEKGGELGPALAEMQSSGIAEADASLDVDGWDAAAKTAALANVLMRAGITPHDVDRAGIAELTGDEVRTAAGQGFRWKLVSSAGYEDGQLFARVAPERVPADDLLARLDGIQNALIIDTDLLGRIGIVQLDSGLTATAYALLSDVVSVRRAIGSL